MTGPIVSASTVAVPKGAQVVNATGKYLMPGLWDPHVHPQSAAVDLYYPLFTAHGVTGIRNAGSNVLIDTVLQWCRKILAGTV